MGTLPSTQQPWAAHLEEIHCLSSSSSSVTTKQPPQGGCTGQLVLLRDSTGACLGFWVAVWLEVMLLAGICNFSSAFDQSNCHLPRTSDVGRWLLFPVSQRQIKQPSKCLQLEVKVCVFSTSFFVSLMFTLYGPFCRINFPLHRHVSVPPLDLKKGSFSKSCGVGVLPLPQVSGILLYTCQAAQVRKTRNLCKEACIY